MSIWQQILKRAARDLVKAVGGGADGSALCRVRQQDLSDYGNRDQMARFMPIDVARDLEQVAAFPFVTAALAAEAGYMLVKAPAAIDAGDWLGLIGSLSTEAGDVVAKIARLAAGGMAPREVREADLVREADELIRVALQVRGAAMAVLADEAA
jgi:hypothetical protein